MDVTTRSQVLHYRAKLKCCANVLYRRSVEAVGICWFSVNAWINSDYWEISEILELAGEKKKPDHLNECGSPNVQLYEHWISTLSQRGNIAQIQFAFMSVSTFTSYCKRPQLHLFVFSLITYCWNSLKLPFPLSPTILRSFRVLNRLPVTPRVHLALHADHFLSVQIKKVHTSRPPQLLTQLIWWQLL